MFRDNAPMSAAEAAAVILQGVATSAGGSSSATMRSPSTRRYGPDPEHAYDTHAPRRLVERRRSSRCPRPEASRLLWADVRSPSVGSPVRSPVGASHRGVSTRSLALPSGNTNGARTPVWATASGSASGPRPRRRRRRPPSDATAGPAPRRDRWTGSASLDQPVDDAVLFVAELGAGAVAGGSSGDGGAEAYHSRSNAIGVGIAVGAPERFVGIVERGRVGLVADRPLLSGATQWCSAHSASPLTMNGSARTGT